MSGTRFRQGDVVLVPFPFADLSAVKQRPVLILSADTSGDDVITCGITSNISRKKHSIPIEQAQFTQGTLPKKSLIRVDKLFTLEKQIIKRRFGRIDQETLDSVKAVFCGLI